MSDKNDMKNNLKERFDKNNNYKQILSKIERKDDMKKTNYFKYSLVPIGLLLIISIISLFSNRPNTLLDSNGQNNIVINNTDNIIRGSLRVDAEIRKINDIDIFQKYGVNKELIIPNDLTLDSYCLYGKFSADQYDKLIDCRLVYLREGETIPTITIAMAKNNPPFRDYLFANDNLKESIINNVQVVITQYEDIYFTAFKINDIYFDIETNGITQNELVDLLKSIIN